MKKIILASGSPRRKEILEMCGFDFEVIKSECEEKTTKSEPWEIVCELSKQKALDVKSKINGTDNDGKIILGADTIVVLNGRIFGKPKNYDDAKNMLTALSGNMHSVFTGICIIKENEVVSAYEKTDVYFKAMSDKEIENYLNTNEPFDKAGSYAVQGKGAMFIERIDGDYFNVVGLPVSLVYDKLKELSVL